MTSTLDKHLDADTRKQFNKELFISLGIGSIQGGLVGVTSGYVINKYMPTFTKMRVPLKVLFYSSFVFLGAFYEAERQVKKFRVKLINREVQKRERILDLAAENGIFLDNDLTIPESVSKNI